MARVLITTDGSDLSLHAAREGLRIIGRDHQFIILAVVRSSLITPPVNETTSTAPGRLNLGERDELDSDAGPIASAEHWETEAEEDVEVLARELSIDAKRRVDAGDPADAIRRIAQEEGAELIVLGSHGRSLARRLVRGSVSREVLEQAPCPVLIVPEKA